MKEETLKIITAEEGKTFARASNGEILGNKLSFDVRFGSVSDYVEVDAPTEAADEENQI